MATGLTDVAQQIIDAAVAEASEAGVAAAISICDTGGHLVAFWRMPSTTLVSIGVSQQKAYTAAAVGLGTARLGEFLDQDAPLAHVLRRRSDIAPLGGGEPIRIGGSLVGGLGISGGHWTQDAAIASDALARVDGIDAPEGAAD